MKTAFLMFNYEKNGKPNMPVMFHALLFASEMKEKGDDVKIILEGEAVKWAKDLLSEDHPLKNHFEKLNDDFVACEACSSMFGVLDDIKDKIKIENDLHGHVSLKGYMDEDYKVVDF